MKFLPGNGKITTFVHKTLITRVVTSNRQKILRAR